MRQMVPADLPEPTYREEMIRDAYYAPCVSEPAPSLWIPKDPAGVSRQEVAHSGKVVMITDEGATLDERGALTLDLGVVREPIKLERIMF